MSNAFARMSTGQRDLAIILPLSARGPVPPHTGAWDHELIFAEGAGSVVEDLEDSSRFRCTDPADRG